MVRGKAEGDGGKLVLLFVIVNLGGQADGDCFDRIQVGWEETRRSPDLVEAASAGTAEFCFVFACYDMWLFLARVFFFPSILYVLTLALKTVLSQ